MNSFKRALIILAVGGGLLFPVQIASAQLSEGVQVDFASEDTFFALVFHPQTMLEHCDDEIAEEFTTLIRQHMKVDLNDAQQILIQYSSNIESRYGDFSVVVKFNNEIDMEECRAVLLGNIEFHEEEYGDEQYYQPDGRNGPTVYSPNANTIAFGTEKSIKQLIDVRANSRAMDQLTEINPECDLCGVMSFSDNPDGVREALNLFFKNSPFDSARVVDGLMKITDGRFQIELDEQIAGTGIFHTQSPEAATEVAATVNQQIESFGNFLKLTSERSAAHADVQPRLLALDGMKRISDSTKASADGLDVIITIDNEDGLKPALNLIVKSMTEGLKERAEVMAADR